MKRVFNNRMFLVLAISIASCISFSSLTGCGFFGSAALNDIPSPTRLAEGPYVVSVSPADGATGVSVNSDIEVVFSEAMDETTITADVLSLAAYDESGVLSVVASDITAAYDGSSYTARFSSSLDFNFETTYVATVRGTVTDIDGDVMDEDFSWSFTITSADRYLSIITDIDFGTDGLLTIDPGRSVAMGAGIKVQSDGKIIFSGYNGDDILGQNAKLAVARVDQVGNLDEDFGAGGIATLDCTSKLGLNWWAKHGLALQSDGKILVGGECDRVATVFRLLSDGTPDPSFGIGGKAVLPTDPGQVHSTVFVLATQQRGGEEKIIVGGQLEPASWRAEWLLARLNNDGSLDNTFAGGAGILFQQWRYYDEGIIDMALRSDGSIIAYGSSIDAAGDNRSDFAVAHYSADGVLDNSFAEGDSAGVAGLAVIDFGLGDWPYSIQLMSDGRIVGGVHVNADDTGATSDNDFGVFRLTADGKLDSSFGTDGKVEIDFGFNSTDIGNALVVLPDGQIIVGGEVNNGVPNPAGGWSFWENNDFGLVMLDESGNINRHFGDGGFLRTDFLGDHDDILAMALYDVVTDVSGDVQSFKLAATGLAKDPSSGDLRYAVANYKSLIIEIAP